MFRVHVLDGQTPLPDDDIYYIVAKEGIFLRKKMGIMDSVAPVKNISILQSVEKTAKMNIKKIPGGQIARVIAFFKEVYAQYYGESIVLLFYDEERKVYKIVPPHQKVTAAACDYNKGITIEGMQMIGTIHSHARMSAFHSGVDDHDEEHFDGLHITIGNVNDDEVSISASIVANGHRFKVEPEEYVERLVLTKDIDEPETTPTRRVFKWDNGKMVEDVTATQRYTYTTRRYDKRYVVDVSDRYHKVIPEWMGMVEKGVYTPPLYRNFGYGQYGWGAHQVQAGNRGWGGNYDSSLWHQAGRNNVGVRNASVPPVTPPGQSPFNVGVKVKPIEFPKHELDLVDLQDVDNFPCSSCVFRSHKFLAESNDVDFEYDVYKCTQCEQIIIDDQDEQVMLPICPTCKTDEFLEIVSEDDLPNSYVGVDDVSHLQKEPGLKADSEFVTCQACHNSFHIFAGETVCPFCYTLVGELEGTDASVYSSEDSLIKTQQNDMGEFLGADSDEIQNAALQEAAKADQTLERIPDPAEGIIPLPEKTAAPAEKTVHVGKQVSDGTLFAMLKKVFGGKGRTEQ